MSTSYYLSCEKCKECYWVGQYGLKFFTFYSGEPACMKGIAPFIEKHLHCGVRIQLLPESLVDDYRIAEWPDADSGKEARKE